MAVKTKNWDRIGDKIVQEVEYISFSSKCIGQTGRKDCQ